MSLDRLDRNVVHEICTNQVVVTLHACVKELVENALDAETKRVELRLRESGGELLEVVDDGHGISPENYEKLATRHATSKIREYDDLSQSLNTFGFRGEALAAICAMGDVTVCTRTANDSTATLLTYDRFGKLVSQVPAAREVGTTLSVRELFKRVPVRHREFLRNAKAQVSATLRLIQSYAIAQPAIRFHVLAEKMRGHGAGRSTLLSSSGTARGWSQAAAAVLGDAVLSDVAPFELQSESTGWSVSGLLSKASGGRRSRDSQLFFVNRRPIDPPKRIGKLINDTFHQYNARNWPVVILSFSGSQGLVDVNVTPDKKTVFLHNEESLLTALQEGLTTFYAPSDNGEQPDSVLADFGIKSLSSSSSSSSRAPSIISSAAAMLYQHAAASASQQEMGGMATLAGASPSQDANTSMHVPVSGSVDNSSIPSSQQAETSASFSSQGRDVRGGAQLSMSQELGLAKSSSDSRSSGDAHVYDFRETQLQTSASAVQKPQIKPSEVSLSTTSLTPVLDESDNIELHVTELENPADSAGTLPSAEVAVTHLTLDEDSGGEDMLVTQFSLDDATGQETQAARALPLANDSLSQSAPVQEPLVTQLTLDDLDQGSIAGQTLPFTDQGLASQPMHLQLAADAMEDSPMDAGYAIVAAEPMGDNSFDNQTALVPTNPSALPGAPSRVKTLCTSVSMPQLEAAISRRRRRAVASTQHAPSEPCVQFPSAFSLSSLRDGAADHASLEEVATFGSSGSVESPGTSASRSTSAQPEDGSQLKFDKSCFSKMRVIGQFNLGFIIAALRTQTRKSGGDSHNGEEGSSPDRQAGLQLFIIDQHASDEKVRFERLNVDSKIDRQPLVSPHFLQLTPAQEQLAESNHEVFRLNGFEIHRDDTRPPGRRMRLSTLPTCQGLIFNEKDVHDLLYTLEEAESQHSRPNTKDASKGSGLLDLTGHRALWSSTAVPRPKKVWSLLACRACRGAIMIGKALRINEMERILVNLGTLHQPWNCPHGRPTMRHLIDARTAWQAPRRKPVLSEILWSLQAITEPLPLTM